MSSEDRDVMKVLADVYSKSDRQEMKNYYVQWAEHYEKDASALHYTAPERLLAEFNKFGYSKDVKVLDVLGGTGLLALELIKNGYTNLHTIDGSEAMAAKAKERGIYKSYTIQSLEPDTKMPFADGEFDVVLMTGVFCPGHLPVRCLHEIARVCKKGGVVGWVCCDPDWLAKKDSQYADGYFYKVIDEIKASGKWKKRDGYPIKIPYHTEVMDCDGYVMIYDIVA